jgi:hypothetical protein
VVKIEDVFVLAAPVTGICLIDYNVEFACKILVGNFWEFNGCRKN